MTEKTEHSDQTDTAADAPPGPAGDELRYDATTNFSLLGWILDRLSKKTDDRQQVDLE